MLTIDARCFHDVVFFLRYMGKGMLRTIKSNKEFRDECVTKVANLEADTVSTRDVFFSFLEDIQWVTLTSRCSSSNHSRSKWLQSSSRRTPPEGNMAQH